MTSGSIAEMDLPRGYVPPGHNQIMPIKVITAWRHTETGCWLSAQAIGPAVALVWRSSDSWKATPYLADEICATLDLNDNLKAAYRLAHFFLDQGPPKELLESAERSAEVRSEKASKAGKAKAEKSRQLKLASITSANVDLEKGPRAEAGKWDWESYDAISYWRDVGAPDTYFTLQRARDQTYSLTRNWITNYGVSEADVLVQGGLLSQCFGLMELLTKKSPDKWRRGFW